MLFTLPPVGQILRRNWTLGFIAFPKDGESGLHLGGESLLPLSGGPSLLQFPTPRDDSLPCQG